MSSIRSNKRRVYRCMGYEIRRRPLAHTSKVLQSYWHSVQAAASKIGEVFANLGKALNRIGYIKDPR